LEFRVWGLGVNAYGLGGRGKNLKLWVQGLGLRVTEHPEASPTAHCGHEAAIHHRRAVAAEEAVVHVHPFDGVPGRHEHRHARHPSRTESRDSRREVRRVSGFRG